MGYNTYSVITCRILNAEAWVCAQGSPNGIRGGQSVIGTGVSSIVSVFLSVSFHRCSRFAHTSPWGWIWARPHSHSLSPSEQ
jgi:hypothetical protein